MSARTIEQKIAAGSNFDGTAPTTTRVNEKDMERYPEDTVGGLFEFGLDRPTDLIQVMIKFGGQATWSLSLVDADDVEIVLASGTTEASFFSTTDVGPLAGLLLLEGQRLKLVTAGASTAMVARVSVDQYRS